MLNYLTPNVGIWAGHRALRVEMVSGAWSLNFRPKNSFSVFCRICNRIKTVSNQSKGGAETHGEEQMKQLIVLIIEPQLNIKFEMLGFHCEGNNCTVSNAKETSIRRASIY